MDWVGALIKRLKIKKEELEYIQGHFKGTVLWSNIEGNKKTYYWSSLVPNFLNDTTLSPEDS